VASILNLAPDHLDRHPSLRDYVEAKARIFENQRPEDFAIINSEDPLACELSATSRATTLTVAVDYAEADAAIRRGMIAVSLWGEGVEICPAGDFSRRGRHHLANVLVAATIARLLGAEPAAVARAIRGYRPPEHHMEVAGEIAGVTFINDSKASNPAAAAADLGAMDRPFVAIVGGKDKGADFTALGRLLAERPRAVILIGEAAGRIAEAMGEEAAPERASSLEEAIRRAAELAEPGDAVIMAPACSSFDMFDDYAHRGRVFRDTAAMLASEETR